jgi:hypothetical protein
MTGDPMHNVTVSFSACGEPLTQSRSFLLPLSHVVYALATLGSLARRNGRFGARKAFTQLLDGARDEHLAQIREAVGRALDAELGRGWLGRRVLRKNRDRIVEAVMGTVYDDITLIVDELGDASSRLYDMSRDVNRLQNDLTNRTQKVLP